MATKTKTLYSKASSTPSPPVVGQRCDNMIKDIWGTSNSSVIAVGSGVNRTYAERVITPLDTISNISPLSTVMALEPTSAIASGSGRGFDFNILTANKKYTFGVGFIQNRDNVFYVGASTSGGTGSYTKGAVLAKNTPRYYICKIIPSGQTEIYPNESGAYNLSFAKQESLNVLTSADLTKVRMLLGYTAAEGAERYSSTVGMFFRPFCYEGETWFEIKDMPWKAGTKFYACEVEYEDTTNLITKVGAIIQLGFVASGNFNIETMADLHTGSRNKSIFNNSKKWKFTDGKTCELTLGDSSAYPYQEHIDLTPFYKQDGTGIGKIAYKGTRPIYPFTYSYSVTGTSSSVVRYLKRNSNGSVWIGTTTSASDSQIIPPSVGATRLLAIVQGGGSGGGGSNNYDNGWSGSGGGCRIAVIKIEEGKVYKLVAGNYGEGGAYGQNSWSGAGGVSYIEEVGTGTLISGTGGGSTSTNTKGSVGTTTQNYSGSRTWGSYAWNGLASSTEGMPAYSFGYWQESGRYVIPAQSGGTRGGASRFGTGGARGSTNVASGVGQGYGAGGGGGGGGSFLGGNATGASRGSPGAVWVYY